MICMAFEMYGKTSTLNLDLFMISFFKFTAITFDIDNYNYYEIYVVTAKVDFNTKVIYYKYNEKLVILQSIGIT